MVCSIEDDKRFREEFRRRRIIRIAISAVILFLLIGVTLAAFPSWRLFGMPKLIWAPFFYLIMFGLLIGIGVVWRCPACKALLGDVFTTKFCSKCGLRLDDDK